MNIKENEILANVSTNGKPKLEVMGIKNYVRFLSDRKKTRDHDTVKEVFDSAMAGNSFKEIKASKEWKPSQAKDYETVYKAASDAIANTREERNRLAKLGPHGYEVIQAASANTSIAIQTDDLLASAVGDKFTVSRSGSVGVAKGATITPDDMLEGAGNLSKVIDASEEVGYRAKLAFGDMWRHLDDMFPDESRAVRNHYINLDKTKGGEDGKKFLKRISTWKGVAERIPEDVKENVPEDAASSHVIEILGHKKLTDAQKKKIFDKAYAEKLPQKGDKSFRDLIAKAVNGGAKPTKPKAETLKGRYHYLFWKDEDKAFTVLLSNSLNTALIAEAQVEACYDTTTGKFIDAEGEDVRYFPQVATEDDLLTITKNEGKLPSLLDSEE